MVGTFIPRPPWRNGNTTATIFIFSNIIDCIAQSFSDGCDLFCFFYRKSKELCLCRLKASYWTWMQKAISHFVSQYAVCDSYLLCTGCAWHISGSESVTWNALLAVTTTLNLCSVQSSSCELLPQTLAGSMSVCVCVWRLTGFQLSELSSYDKEGSKHAAVSEKG